MRKTRAIALITLVTALAVAGAGWKWGPGSKDPGKPVRHIAGWTWTSDPSSWNPADRS